MIGASRTISEKSFPIIPCHQRRRGGHLQSLHDQHKRYFLHAGTHAVNVRRHPADDAAKFRLVEKRHRHRHQFCEQIRPHVVNDRFAQFEREPLAKMKIHRREQRQRKISRSIPINFRQVAPRNRAVDRAANQPRQRGQLQAARERQNKKPVPLGCVRFRIMKKFAG